MKICTLVQCIELEGLKRERGYGGVIIVIFLLSFYVRRLEPCYELEDYNGDLETGVDYVLIARPLQLRGETRGLYAVAGYSSRLFLDSFFCLCWLTSSSFSPLYRDPCALVSLIIKRQYLRKEIILI